MRRSKPEIFNVSHRLAERAAESWALGVTKASIDPRWRRKDRAEWKAADWKVLRRAFEAGMGWMLKPFRLVCGLDRGPSEAEFEKAWKAARGELRRGDETLRRALETSWHSGRVFLELWIQRQRFPAAS